MQIVQVKFYNYIEVDGGYTDEHLVELLFTTDSISLTKEEITKIVIEKIRKDYPCALLGFDEDTDRDLKIIISEKL